MIQKAKIMYIAVDGVEFNSKTDCEQHEKLYYKNLSNDNVRSIEHNRQQLIKAITDFLKVKDLLIFNLSNHKLMRDEDYKELEQWPISTLIKVAERIDLKHMSSWCIVYNDQPMIFNCHGCGYGKRHGKCNIYDTKNTYGKIYNIISKGDTEYLGLFDDVDSETLNSTLGIAINNIKDALSKFV